MSEILTFEGQNYLKRFLENLSVRAQETGSEVVITNAQWPSENSCDVSEPDEVVDLLNGLHRCGIVERYFCQKSINPQNVPRKLRWLGNSDYPSNITVYAFADMVAIHFWDQSVIKVVRHKQANNNERNRFEKLWEMAEAKA